MTSMTSDAHAVRNFFLSSDTTTLRRKSHPRDFEDSRFHFPNKPLSATMGREREREPQSPRARKGSSSRITIGSSKRHSTGSSQSDRSRRRSLPRMHDEQWQLEEAIPQPQPQAPTQPPPTTIHINKARLTPLECDGRPAALLRVSVNVRYSRKQEALLPFDVFVTAPHGSTLADVYKRAKETEPDNALQPYILRPEKRVYVLFEKPQDNMDCRCEDMAETIAPLNPLRIIFCVKDAPPPPPGVEGMMLNVCVVGENEDMFADDVELDAKNAVCSVSDIWRRFVKAEPELKRFDVRCLRTKRPADGVSLHIALSERVADIATTGSKRFVFEVDDTEAEKALNGDELGDGSIEEEVDDALDEELEMQELDSEGEEYVSDDSESDYDHGGAPAPPLRDEEVGYRYSYNPGKQPRGILRQPQRKNTMRSAAQRRASR